MKKEPIVVGIIGKPGSGKTTLVEVLQKIALTNSSGIRMAAMRFSDVPRALLKKQGKEINRVNLQKFVVDMKRREGEDALSKRVGKSIRAITNIDVVIADGVRWLTDAKMIRSFKKNLLVYVNTPARVRYERICGRGENKDDSTKTFAQFKKEDTAKNESFIASLGKDADIIIYNRGDKAELKMEVEKAFKNKILPLCRRGRAN